MAHRHQDCAGLPCRQTRKIGEHGRASRVRQILSNPFVERFLIAFALSMGPVGC